MPMVKFTKKQFGPPPKGWQLLKIHEVSEVAKKSQPGTNYYFELKFPKLDPERDFTFKMWIPTNNVGVKQEFFEAVFDKKLAIDEEMEFDPFTLTGLEVYGEVIHKIDTKTNKPVAEIVNWQPVSAPPF